MSSRSAIAVIAVTTSGCAVKPSWATNLAARIIRSGSSPKEMPAATGVRTTPAAEVVEPAELVDELAGRQPDGHGVDREVAARQVAVE